jgi:hypothetical protein
LPLFNVEIGPNGPLAYPESSRLLVCGRVRTHAIGDSPTARLRSGGCYDRVFRTDTRIKAPGTQQQCAIPWYSVAQHHNARKNSPNRTASRDAQSTHEASARPKVSKKQDSRKAKRTTRESPASGRCESCADHAIRNWMKQSGDGAWWRACFRRLACFACLSCRPRAITALPENPSITNTIAC